jgi:hypothetical protein
MAATPKGPNPLTAAWSIWRASRARPPRPAGTGTTDHAELVPVLSALQAGGVAALADQRPAIAAYRDRLATIDPDALSRDAALAYWLNLYNAGALDLAADTFAQRAASVLRLPGAFQRTWATIAGEDLSLDAIEHGKVRRFGDPRIHAALVCGSASCPTLRYEPYDGDRVDLQLNDQMRAFLAGGGAAADRGAEVLRLSRIFLWYGGDFARPHKMPAWWPPRAKNLTGLLAPWLDPEIVRWVQDTAPQAVFQPYDWSLACTVR